MSHLHRHELPPSRKPRLLALPLVVVLVLAYLGSVAHVLLVHHHTCIEHGEMVDDDGLEQGDASAEASTSFSDEHLACADAHASMRHGADAHCAHNFLRRMVQLSTEVTLSLEGPVSHGPVLEVDSKTLEPQVAWLHLAPKASPPLS